MDKSTKIELTLDGEFVDAKQFLQGVEHFIGLIKEVADVVSADGPKVDWLVKVREGSNVLEAYPTAVDGSLEKGKQCIVEIESGLRSLEEKAKRPRNFTDKALKHARGLSGIVGTLGSKIDNVKIGSFKRTINITHQSYANIEKILGVHVVSFGSVEGKLRLISDIRGDHVVIEDPITHKKIRCNLEPGLDEIFHHFGERVSVNGLVKYRKDGEIVSVQVRDYRIIGGKQLPTADDVKGILKDLG